MLTGSAKKVKKPSYVFSWGMVVGLGGGEDGYRSKRMYLSIQIPLHSVIAKRSC